MRPARVPWRRPALGVLVLLLACVACSVLDWDLGALSSPEARTAAWLRFCSFLGSFGAPNLSSEYLLTATHLMLQTLAVAVLGTVLGAIGGYLLALAASRAVFVAGSPAPTGALVRLQGWLRRGLCELARLLLDVLRGIPDFAWAIVILAIPGPGPVTGILAIAVSLTGILGKIFSELWDNVPPARYEAVRTTGAGRLVVFGYGIQPLAARSMLSFTLMRFECAVRNASVIGVVGGGGLGAQLFDEFNYGNFDNVVTLLLAMLVLTASVDLFANLVRYRLRPDPQRPRSAELRGALLRRAGGLAWVVALVVFCTLYLTGMFGGRAAERPPFQAALAEMQRVEWRILGDDFSRLLTPDLRWTQPLADGTSKPGALQEALDGALVPLAMGLLGSLLGILAAGLLAYPSSIAFGPGASNFTGERRGRVRQLLRWCTVLLARGLALVMRAIPEVAWLWIFATFFTLGVLPAILAMALHTTGVLARVFTETVDDIPYRSYERSYMGSRSQLFAYAAVPRSLHNWLSYTFFQFESNVRTSVSLGIIGVGGLGDSFDWSFKFWALERASTFLLAMILLTTAIDRLSRALRLRRGTQG